MTFFALSIAALGAIFFVNYLTSTEALAKFSLDNLLESSNFSRDIYEGRVGAGSNFEIDTTNPLLLGLNGLFATFFRPFPWEINSFIALFSAIESFAFLLLIIFLIYKKGFITPFKGIFSMPILIFAFSFAIIFATSVGVSTTNFGSLSRYKIPCLPFYLIFIIGAYHQTRLSYPVWMQKILLVLFGKQSNNYVWHSRVN